MSLLYKRRVRRTPKEMANYATQRVARIATKKIIILLMGLLAIAYGSVQKFWTGDHAAQTPAISTEITPSAIMADTMLDVKKASGAPIWTRSKNMSAEQNAAAHFKKHGAEFGFKSKAEYINTAHEFLKNPPKDALIIKQKDGDTVIYDPTRNWFAVKSKRGTPRTLFKLDPNIHGYPTNMDYFNAQKGK